MSNGRIEQISKKRVSSTIDRVLGFEPGSMAEERA
jgi:hypothetical protein